MSASPRPQLAIELRTTASRVAEALRAELLDGAYAPGAPLREAELSARTGVSRPTIREALAELARDGLVVHSLHRGMEVVRLEPADVRDVYGTRRAIEQAGLARLAGAGEAPQLAALSAAVEAMARAAQARNRRAVVEADVAFHAALARACGLVRLERAHRAAMLELRLALSVADRADDDQATVLASHRRLHERIAAGPRREAARALDHHLREAEERVCAVLAQAESPPDRRSSSA